MKEPISMREARVIYKGLGFSEKDLQEEVAQANRYGMDPSYRQTPYELAQGYAREYRRVEACDERADRQFVESSYGRD